MKSFKNFSKDAISENIENSYSGDMHSQTNKSNFSADEKIISITVKLKIQEEILNSLRKDLNNNIRECIAFNAINKSHNKKALDKSINYQKNFRADLKMTCFEINDQIRKEESEYHMVKKKFNLLNDDLEKISKLSRNLEERIRICEVDVGINGK